MRFKFSNFLYAYRANYIGKSLVWFQYFSWHLWEMLCLFSVSSLSRIHKKNLYEFEIKIDFHYMLGEESLEHHLSLFTCVNKLLEKIFPRLQQVALQRVL